MMKPKVSVIMITYAHEKFIEQAIEGVLAQRCKFKYELIISNDCSPDDTDTIVQRYKDDNPEVIRYYYQEGNIGMMPNFFFALEKAEGDYIAFCEGDDYWTDSDKLQKQIDFLENNKEYGLVYTDLSFFDQLSQSYNHDVFKKGHLKPNTEFNELIKLAYIAPCTWVFRKEVFDEIEYERLLNAKDGTFVIMLEFALRSKIYFLPQNTAVYRMLPESASRSKNHFRIYERDVSLWKTQLQYMSNIKDVSLRRDINGGFVSKSIRSIYLYQDRTLFLTLANKEISYKHRWFILIKASRFKFIFNLLSKFFRKRYSFLFSLILIAIIL